MARSRPAVSGDCESRLSFSEALRGGAVRAACLQTSTLRCSDLLERASVACLKRTSSHPIKPRRNLSRPLPTDHSGHTLVHAEIVAVGDLTRHAEEMLRFIDQPSRSGLPSDVKE